MHIKLANPIEQTLYKLTFSNSQTFHTGNLFVPLPVEYGPRDETIETFLRCCFGHDRENPDIFFRKKPFGSCWSGRHLGVSTKFLLKTWNRCHLLPEEISDQYFQRPSPQSSSYQRRACNSTSIVECKVQSCNVALVSRVRMCPQATQGTKHLNFAITLWVCYNSYNWYTHITGIWYICFITHKLT